ncbi:MAG: hypothetical protein HZB42_09875 [Sphingobacteriales bacterium]|nr:hypothetical protein [Sphingobacteriales bacterium]
MRFIFLFVWLLSSALLPAQSKFTHTTGSKNISGNSTYLSAEGLNGNPGAIIIVEADYENRKMNPHPVGVWYTGSQWAVFNQDMAIMPEGISFSITWNNPDANSFYQKFSKANQQYGRMFIESPSLNNNPSATFYVSQVWNPVGIGGVYNNSDITVEYDKQLGKWAVVNLNGGGLTDGSAYNIIIVPEGMAKNDPGFNKPVTYEVKEEKKYDVSNIPKNYPVNPINDGKEIKNAGVVPKQENPVMNVPVDIAVNPGQLADAAFGNNFGFEFQLFNWTATGAAFSNQPVEGNTVKSERVLTSMAYNNGGIGGDYWKNIDYPIGFKETHWIGTYENGNGDTPTGTLTSGQFLINKRYLHFLLGGGKDINRLYVELQIKKSDYQAVWGESRRGFYGDTDDGFTRAIRITSSLNSEELFRYYFDLGSVLNNQYVNKTARIVIVDNATGRWGHINVDDFTQADNLNDLIPLMRDGFNLYADKDKPVWGFFDSHAHPAADEAFGKKYYVGSSRAPLSSAWGNDVCTRAHTFGLTLDGFTNVFDPHKFFDGGWPDMWGYPRFNGKMHQKYHVDLIKRAWQGGLKIFCALGINNMYLATRALGHGTNGEAIDDESVLLRQTNVMKEMARTNNSWMEIAYTPADARRIILEGKLCVILGLESDVFGNFKSPDCNWVDRSEDLPLVSITEADANAKLEQKLNRYYDLGLRQVLPLHYLSKPFGGTAVFNGNTFLPQMEFYTNVRVKGGVPDRIGFSLYEDFPTMPAFTGNFVGYTGYAARIQKQDEGAEISMVSADGLTPVGTILFRKLMKKGFIVDQEHASYQTKREIFRIANENGNYPVMASHCDPQGLAFIWTRQPVRYNGSNDDKLTNFRTTTIRNVAHEMELNDESYNGIQQTGGTIGVFLSMNHKQKYTGAWGDIPNDCSGSTKTFAQMYLYSLDKMNGKGVGLSSDLPMIDAICPRFGPFTAWGSTSENEDVLKVGRRTRERYAQTNGVRYDVPSRSYHHSFFEGSDNPGWEEDAYKALAAWDAGVNPFTNESAIAISGEPGHADRVRSYARGLFADNLNQLRTCCGDTPFEEAAMFLLKNNIADIYNYLPAGFWRDHSEDVTRVYNNIRPIFTTWIAKNGNNEPLRRYITGNRYWDFNIDGLAHYGLLPDLLQDLKNIGLSPVQLSPLFGSAEDYIRMWEKAEAAKANVRE